MKHAITTAPIIAALAQHHKVSVLGPNALKASLDQYLTRTKSARRTYRFMPSTLLNVLRDSGGSSHHESPRVRRQRRQRPQAPRDAAGYAMLLARNIPIALELHQVGTLERASPNSKTRGWYRLIERILLKRFYARVRMIIVFDDPIRDEVIRRTDTTLPIIVGPPTVPGAAHHEASVRAEGALIRVVMPRAHQPAP